MIKLSYHNLIRHYCTSFYINKQKKVKKVVVVVIKERFGMRKCGRQNLEMFKNVPKFLKISVIVESIEDCLKMMSVDAADELAPGYSELCSLVLVVTSF
jgi:hypothetical protein